MKTAFENRTGDQFLPDDELIAKAVAASRESARKRVIIPIHRTQDAEVQRMLNVLQPGTYIRLHKHPMAHAAESVVVLQGAIRFYRFSDDGAILQADTIRAGGVNCFTDIEPGVWHTFTVLEEDTVLFECKKGPYDPQTDKEFATWAPEEGTPEALLWMERFTKDR
jgi:cupin fold WbuC family metalloprotein